MNLRARRWTLAALVVAIGAALALRRALRDEARGVMPLPPVACLLPWGGRCTAGARCVSPDATISCVCAHNGVRVDCTAREVERAPRVAHDEDAGVAGACAGDDDCTPDAPICYFTAGSCVSRGRCRALVTCEQPVSFCDCAGRAFLDCPGAPTHPARIEGECEEVPRAEDDAGADEDVSVSGQDAASPCAGARWDERLAHCVSARGDVVASDCCRTVPCSPWVVRCATPAPRCAEGQLPTVVDGCWGPCVLAQRCATFRCGARGRCPEGFRCTPAYACEP